MKSVSFIALITALISLCLSAYQYLKPSEFITPLEQNKTPEMLMKSYVSQKIRFAKASGINAESYFLRTHEDEILKTLELVDTKENSDLSLNLYRYSVGTKIFREAMWAKKIDQSYYFISYVSTYEPEPWIKNRLGWVELMKNSEKDWEKESALMW